MREWKTRAVLHPGRKTALKTAIRRSAVDRLVQFVPEDVEQVFFIVRADAEEGARRDGRSGVVDGTAEAHAGDFERLAVARPDHMRLCHSPELVSRRVGFGCADDRIIAPKVAFKRRGEASGKLQYLAGMPGGGPRRRR